jgi:hypothetical protein
MFNLPKLGPWPQPHNDKCQNPKLKSSPNDKYPNKNPDASMQDQAKEPVQFSALTLGF